MTSGKIVVASGYFNPLHVGHLEYLTMARSLGDHLIVIVNTDVQVGLKGAKPFMNERDRLALVRALDCVDFALLAADDDGSVCRTLELLRPHIFAKGGDRYWGNIPENAVCERLGIEIVDGLGAKIRSSSELIRNVAESAISTQ